MTSGRYGVDVFDESYVRHGQRYLQVRVYAPRGPGPFPVLLSAHGGAWNSGSRATNASLDRALAARGILVMAPDFRQPPLARYPASVADLHLAARWARAGAARFGGRADRVGGLGTSSGAHQLLLNALVPSDPRYRALPLDLPQAGPPPPGPLLHHLALCWPIVNPLERYRWARRNSLHKLVASHERYWDGEPAMADGGPQQIIERRAPAAGGLPDLLMVQGTADDNIPAGATERFTACYRAAGGRADLHLFAGQPHGFITRDVRDPDSVAAIDRIARFVALQSGKGADLSHAAR
jgi:acetyl esterase